VVVFVGCLISVAVFRLADGEIVSQAKANFERAAIDRIFSVQRTIAAELESLHSIAAFFDSAPSVGTDEFRSFVASALSRHQSVQALEWVPRVRASKRSAYERRARDSGISDFQITESKAPGLMVGASQMDEYLSHLLCRTEVV
jgi:CHASE1-domain containing sensor protein